MFSLVWNSSSANGAVRSVDVPLFPRNTSYIYSRKNLGLVDRRSGVTMTAVISLFECFRLNFERQHIKIHRTTTCSTCTECILLAIGDDKIGCFKLPIVHVSACENSSNSCFMSY